MADLIHELAQLIVQDNAILFVGSNLRDELGESPLVDQIADALAARIEYQDADRSLPAVAQDFQALHGRRALLVAIADFLKGTERKPSTLDLLIADAVLPSTKVITTRFNQLLEEALDDFGKPYVRIVRDVDVPFLDLEAARVALIKVQGDIDDPDSLIITKDDIADFISRLPTVSDLIRAFFATKTLIFLGYDLSSEHFSQLYRQVVRNVGAYKRTAYAITGQPVREAKRRYWENEGIEVCLRDPVDFLQALAAAVKASVQAPGPAAEEPERAAVVQPLPPRPYKALDSFTAADSAIFAGRGEESQRLAARILGHRLTVLYGESGSGKTSLLQAGTGPLLPRLAKRRVLLAVTTPAPGETLEHRIAASLRQAAVDAGLQATPADDADVADLVRAYQQETQGPVVLALDQFEQFFLTGDDEQRAAATGLMQQWRHDRRLDLWQVLLIREDFLGRLQTLDAQLPGLLDVRFRLERLGREAARAAIEEPAAQFDITWEASLVDGLLDDLYQGNGVAPPQLQIVCDRLYQALVDRAGGQDQVAGRRITAALFEELGGTAAILGDYLDRAVDSFPAQQQPAVRTLLGALVSSSGVKQRLPLADLARAAELEPGRARAILDRLVEQRLVRRIGSGAADSGATDASYELVHDSMVARIARWLGDDFWADQKARELIRQALPGWREQARLMAPDDLRLAGVQAGRLRLGQDERELLYATSVAYGDAGMDWQLAPETRLEVLRRLLAHPEPAVRARAATRLAADATLDGDRAALLPDLAVQDAATEVRSAAALAVASLVGQDDVVALDRLCVLADQPATATRATEALVTVRDQQPESQALLPAALRGPVRRRVWRRRWQRHQSTILAATVQAFIGGFLGLALGLGLYLAFNGIGDLGQLELNTVLAFGWGFGLPVGLAGGFALALAGLTGAATLALQDRPAPRRRWALVSGLTAVLLTLTLLASMYVLDLPVPNAVAAGLAYLALGFGVAGVALWPLSWPWPLRMAVTALVGLAITVLATAAGWTGWLLGEATLSGGTLAWLAISGAIAGAGVFAGLNPGFWRARETGS